MRCKNCGWTNPDNALTCEKCRSKLTSYNPKRPSATRPGDDRDLGRTPTVMGASGLPPMPDCPLGAPFGNPRATPNNGGGIVGSAKTATPPPAGGHFPGLCPGCSYPVSELMDSCPNCGFDLRPYKPKTEPKEEQRAPTQSGTAPDLPSDDTTPGEGQPPVFAETVMRENPIPDDSGLRKPEAENDNAENDPEKPEKEETPTPEADSYNLEPEAEAESQGTDPEIDGLITEEFEGSWIVEPDPDRPVYIRVKRDHFRLREDDELLIDGKEYIFSNGSLHKKLAP